MMSKEIGSIYGAHLEKALLEEIIQVGTFKEVSAGTTLVDIGHYVKGMPLLISGAIKILREDKNGDELLLYYIEQGETCSMTINCCLGQKQSEIRAIAETDIRLVMVPIIKMEEWTTKYRSWRQFIFNSYHERLSEVLQTLDSVAFNSMDQRLMAYLKKKSEVNNDRHLYSTHQEIAYDLHSSRVVISRLLKKLEQMGHIALHRNHIEIINLESDSN